MSPDLIIAIINLVTKVGFDAAIALVNGLKNAATIDDAIAALEASKSKTWEQYKQEAANPVVVPPVPPTP